MVIQYNKRIKEDHTWTGLYLELMHVFYSIQYVRTLHSAPSIGIIHIQLIVYLNQKHSEKLEPSRNLYSLEVGPGSHFSTLTYEDALLDPISYYCTNFILRWINLFFLTYKTIKDNIILCLFDLWVIQSKVSNVFTEEKQKTTAFCQIKLLIQDLGVNFWDSLFGGILLWKW